MTLIDTAPGKFRRLVAVVGICAPATAATLVMGAIQSDPQRIYGKLQPMADYVGPGCPTWVSTTSSSS